MRWCAPLLALAVLEVQMPAYAQAWTLQADGRNIPWVDASEWPLDSLHQGAEEALRYLHRSAYLNARIDSHVVADDGSVTLIATLGEKVAVSCVQLTGVAALDLTDLESTMAMQPGAALEAQTLESDIQRIITAYVRAGYPLAEIVVASLGVDDASCLTLEITEGAMPLLGGLVLAGANRTRTAFVERSSGLQVGFPLGSFLPEEIRSRLQETGIFRNVGVPSLALDEQNAVVIRIPVEEGSPGVFDLALGYEPSQDGSGRGRLVGSGHLEMRNMFGAGRRFSLEIRRPPGRTSRLNAHASDPYVFGWPIQTAASFEGLQQDSTFGRREYSFELGYRLRDNLTLYATLSRMVTHPGSEGLLIVDGVQRIAESQSNLLGAGMRFSRIDRQISPRRGLEADWTLERGRRNSYRRTTEAGSGVRSVQSLARLRARVRAYVSVTTRQVAVLGGEANLLRSDDADISEYFRLGGAATLRGYDEEQFAAPLVARKFVEYRYLVDQATYGAVFLDVGFVGGTEVAGFYPGYGAGVQVGIPVGIVAFSLAASTQNPSLIRAHIRLAFGL